MSKDILFVCTGNTCRSPMAMAIFNALSKDKKAESAGIQVAFPSAAAENARAAVKNYGANLDEHISRQITIEDLSAFSLIITMTESQKQFLRSYLNDDKIITLSEFAGEKEDISDPFGGSLALYEETARMIYDYIKKGLDNKLQCHFATGEDLDKLVQMEKEYFPDSWSDKSIKNEIDKDRVIVIKGNGDTVGYCIFMIAADEGEILRIAVEKDMRKKGIGKRLLSSVIHEMKESGCCSVFLEVRASNSAAAALYKSVGFEEAGVRKNYYRDNREDALIYNLKIKDR